MLVWVLRASVRARGLNSSQMELVLSNTYKTQIVERLSSSVNTSDWLSRYVNRKRLFVADHMDFIIRINLYQNHAHCLCCCCCIFSPCWPMRYISPHFIELCHWHWCHGNATDIARGMRTKSSSKPASWLERKKRDQCEESLGRIV